jgi:hypothetical protein
MLRRAEFDVLESQLLAPYAMRSAASRGRVHAETEHAFRLAATMAASRSKGTRNTR